MSDEEWNFLQKLLDPINLQESKIFKKEYDDKLGLFYHHEKTPEITHQVIHANEGFFVRYAPWVKDEFFKFIYLFVKDYSLLDIYRLYDLYILAKQSEKAYGCILEVGVANGGSERY